MPISATGIWTKRSPLRRYRGGFSFIELLVVVVIIAVFAGATILSVGTLGSDREIDREVFRLRTLLELLRDEAVMQNRSYGVLFSETGYRFYIYDPQRLLWFEPIDDRFLRERLLQEPLSLGLRLEDRDITLDREFDPEALEAPEPQVVLLASGEMTPFEAAFYRDLNGGRILLSAALNGTLEVSELGFDAQ
ncbi:MAG: type II secretion system minor pseudopilin GspH [Gammaproteobacteria bacterium]|nr:type II secretion system minor pseudopilin GspH [Gammaproteobacteria bacterium]MCZ6498081.1 type II secretion system minor pseudopilin GspH [Gammaproteobacteria bacterium]